MGEFARANQAGWRVRIPNWRIVSGAGANTGCSWHLEDVEFVEAAIELCDGRPSDIEQQPSQFGGGRDAVARIEYILPRVSSFAAVTYDVVATSLSVFKPGRPFRRRIASAC